jgi:hypothetical protein
MMFDVSQAQDLKEHIQQAKKDREAEAEAEAPPTPETSVPPDDLDQTLAYSKDDVNQLKEMLAQRDAQEASAEEEDDGTAATMMYMPAVSQEAQPVQPDPVEEDDGTAETQMFMPQVGDKSPLIEEAPVTGGNETMMYSPDDREELLKSLHSGTESADEAIDSINATQSYSAEESKALREAYNLLNESKKGGKKLKKKAEALIDQMGEKSPEQLRAEAKALLAETAHPATPSPPSASIPDDLEDEPVEDGGLGTGSLIFILLLLLILAGAATAFILHFMGIIDLPVDLPQLDMGGGE